LKLLKKGVGVLKTGEKMGLLMLDEIVRATGGRVLCGKQREFSGVSIDSRNIKHGELFVALKGARFDGHTFIHDALKEGAGALVNIPPTDPGKGKTIVYVKNTLNALHDIARHLRGRLDVPVIGVTGTNGKTTVKEIIVSIFSERFKVLKTCGNLNNQIGLPLSITRMDGNENVMVLEMGSNMPGDIKQLCEIAHPNLAVVTNVGPAHLEGFGSLEMVRKTDLEILEYVNVASVNADDRFLCEGLRDFNGKLLTYAIDADADVYAKDIVLGDRGSRFTICFPGDRKVEIRLDIAGKFNIYNALAAASLSDEFGMSLEEIKRGIEKFKGVAMRLELKRLDGALVISDVYNANPASMEEAVKELIRLKRRRTIVVLGDMLELGSYAEEAHRKLVRWLSDLKIDVLIAVGPEMIKASNEFTGKFYTAQDSVHAKQVLFNICCNKDDSVLVKGSRGMQMERVFSDVTLKEEGYAL
jgi:UDP-N-acetylmuramoyl-tripeptide--D-alanyl-D-alanine ligase